MICVLWISGKLLEDVWNILCLVDVWDIFGSRLSDLEAGAGNSGPHGVQRLRYFKGPLQRNKKEKDYILLGEWWHGCFPHVSSFSQSTCGETQK